MLQPHSINDLDDRYTNGRSFRHRNMSMILQFARFELIQHSGIF